MDVNSGIVKFNEQRWALLRIRWVSAAASVLYPLWSLVYQAVEPGSYDPLWQRLVMATLPLAATLYTFVPNLNFSRLVAVFHTVCFALTGHVFFLVFRNDLNPLYVLGAYCMIFGAGAGLANLRALFYYFIYCAVICAALCVVRPGANEFILLVGTLTAALVSYASIKSLFELVEKLRQSRKAEEEKREALDGMLNSLGEGFLRFGKDGVCRKEFSKACFSLFETNPSEKQIWEVLRIPSHMRDSLRMKLQLAFESCEQFERFAAVLPKVFEHSKDKKVALEYFPSRKADGSINGVVVVAKDRTEIQKAHEETEHERKNALMIASIIRHKRFFQVFISDFVNGIEPFTQASCREPAEKLLNNFKIFLHSIRGAASLFSIDELVQIIHTFERDWISQANVVDEATIHLRVVQQAQVLDAVLKNFLKINSEVIGAQTGFERVVEIPISEIKKLVQENRFEDVPLPVRSSILDFTMQPIEKYFVPYRDLVNQMAKTQAKKLAPIQIAGGDLELFPEPYQALFSSFVHVFRNAVDHGLETSEERMALGKPAEGKIRVDVAFKRMISRNQIAITFSDDGRGINPNVIRSRLSNCGDQIAATSLSDRDVIQLIFEKGFTTKENITEHSGRGVGLDAVRKAAESLGGSVRVDSVVGKGTSIHLTVPFIEAYEHLREPAHPIWEPSLLMSN